MRQNFTMWMWRERERWKDNKRGGEEQEDVGRQVDDRGSDEGEKKIERRGEDIGRQVDGERRKKNKDEEKRGRERERK